MTIRGARDDNKGARDDKEERVEMTFNRIFDLKMRSKIGCISEKLKLNLVFRSICTIFALKMEINSIETTI